MVKDEILKNILSAMEAQENWRAEKPLWTGVRELPSPNRNPSGLSGIRLSRVYSHALLPTYVHT